MKRLAALTLLGLAACNGLGGGDAPWNTSPTPDSHSQSFFPIAKGTVHDVTAGQMSCDGCHSPQATTFKQFDCTGCHTDATTTPLHTGVTGYQWDSNACYGCHRDASGVLPANHDAALFPVTGTKHATVACSQCHGATKAVADLRCAPCHAQADMASKHAAIPPTTTGTRSNVTVTNYQWASAYCLQCHADGQVNRIASHPAVSNGLSGQDHAPFCLVCHGTLRTDKAWAANFGTYSCLACHTDNSGGLPANHDAALFPVTGTKHASVACSQCHGATRAVADLRCAPCHAQADMASKHALIPPTTIGSLSGATVTNYQWASIYCVRCHADGQVNRIASHPAVNHGLNGTGHVPFCLVCHGTLRTDKAWAALFGSYSCLACHTDNNGGGGG